jgi:leucine dehydrogenase
MTGIIDRMATAGHEQVVFVSNPDAGLRAIIAIHSTTLGPALGGVRFWTYATEQDALVDVLRLSEAMTYKAAAAGLNQGGGKAVVLLEPGQRHDEVLLRALGRAVDEIGGRYIAAEDVGATPEDMDWIATETPWVTGIDEALGGSGDPSPMTALGVLHGMRAACAEAYGSPEIAGRRVVVQGAGHVGSHLVELLTAAGATVAVADIQPERVQALADAHGAERLEHGEALEAECDILAPCALGGVLSADTVPRLRCRIVAGAANNQLADDHAGDLLAERGILYAPDYVINAGGIINIAEEFVGYRRERAARRTARIEETTRRIFALARSRGVSPARAADLFARERLTRLAPLRHRHRPGDRTAWSNGQPLRALRHA